MGHNVSVVDAENPVETTDQPVVDNPMMYHRRVTSFRSRHGSLKDSQQRTWDELWPVLGAEVSQEPLDATAWFGRSAPLVIEIGSGTGTATATMAAAEPEVNLVAVEVYRPGIAQLLKHIKNGGVQNIRILKGDAAEMLKYMIADNSVTGFRVFFPDPWPKARHHKRRFLQTETISLLVDKLRAGGVLHIATDHADYAEFIAEASAPEKRLKPLSGPSPMTLERPQTKFEIKGIRAGSTITEFIWEKIEE
jgi:tRNA (guanine-N7-)-methyltransferase